MNIGDLFVNLGIKGAEKTVGTLGSVKKGMGEIASVSIEAKAGILAALYGLEQMMARSGAAGTGLTNFAALTGLSARTLQQWEYAARQAGVSGEELTGSLKGVQNSMTNMLLGKGAPEGLGLVAKAVGFDTKRARDTFYVMEQLQKAANALPKDLGNNVLKSFGLSEGTIAAMRLNKFTPSIMNKAPLYGDNEINSLNKSNIAWSNLGNKIEMAFGHFNAAHGGSLVNDISKITDQILKLVNAFEQLSEKLKLFQVIGKIFEGWGHIFNGIGIAVDKLSGAADGASEYTDKKGNLKANPVDLLSGWVGKKIDEHFDATPRVPDVGGSAGHVENVNIHQNIVHHGDAKDTKPVKDLHRHSVNSAYRQKSVQRKGS